MIRKYLVAGLVTLLPLVVTLYLLRAIFSGLVDIFRQPLTWASVRLGLPVPPYWELAILSALSTVVLLLAVGLLVGNFLGRQLRYWLDELMMHIPGVKGIYGATKQLLSAIQSGHGGSFKEVVLVEWPHPGSHTLGFIARHESAWMGPEGEGKVAVYIPTAPNPTSGYVVLLDGDRVKPMDVTPEQAFTWVVSGGVVPPKPGA